jgi:hypothetical protein
MMEFALFGGVWNMAQTMAFTLGMAAFYFCDSEKGWQRALGLFFIAAAVGCRPFYALYVPFLMAHSYIKEKEGVKATLPGADARNTLTHRQALARYIPRLIAPALLAIAYGVYNTIRFDNPFEFGHNYLPEFLREPGGQFSFIYFGKNLHNILRMPHWENGLLRFPFSDGFAFWLCNPLFVLFAVYIVLTIVRKKFVWTDALLLAGIAANFFVLLLHKSFGAVQFGTRYLCDLLPAVFFFIHRREWKSKIFWEAPVMLWGVAFCIYGAWLFQTSMYGG